MSQRVYLKPYVKLFNWENSPVNIRIQLSPATVKALQTRLQHAYQRTMCAWSDALRC